MLNCQSGTRSGVLQAFKSLSATAKRSAISCRLVLCSLSHPNLSQSCKLILVTNQKNLRAGYDATEEVVPLCKFTTELLGSINGGIHFSSEAALRLSEGRDDIVHRNPVSDDHDVHVAAAGFSAGCHGSVNEGKVNLGGQNSETAPQDLGNTEG